MMMNPSNRGDDDENNNPKGYYLGIDLGTQGLTALLVEADSSLTVVATGEATYGFVPNLQKDGSYEQNAHDWETALVDALNEIQHKLGVLSSSSLDHNDDDDKSNNSSFNKRQVLAVCVAGQMHGQVMVDSDGEVLGTVRLWCDARNEEEAEFLTYDLFSNIRINRNNDNNKRLRRHYTHPPVKIPKRATVARWLWSIKNQPDLARQCAYLTTPAGWLTYRLTGRSCKNLGIGDASGMFPIDTTTLTYRQDLLEIFDTYVDETYNNTSNEDCKFPRLSDILPDVLVAGQIAGRIVNVDGKWPSNLLPPGAMVAPAEGDQPASLAGSLIGERGMISCSFGTSVVANMVMPSPISSAAAASTGDGGDNNGDDDPSLMSTSSSKNYPAVSPAVDHFCAVNGQPINMVWLRNGTTFMNTIASSFGGNMEQLMSDVIQVPPDCGGLLALPFMDDEPGLNVQHGGTAMIIGYNTHNSTPGHIIKAALLSTMFNLYLGTSKVQGQTEHIASSSVGDEGIQQQQEQQHIVLTGGLSKTPETGQILADIFDRPVRLLKSADEGCAWGAATLARYTWLCDNKRQRHINHGDNSVGLQKVSPPSPLGQGSWPAYLATVHLKQQHEFLPIRENVVAYRDVLRKYQLLLELQPNLDQIMQER